MSLSLENQGKIHEFLVYLYIYDLDDPHDGPDESDDPDASNDSHNCDYLDDPDEWDN